MGSAAGRAFAGIHVAPPLRLIHLHNANRDVIVIFSMSADTFLKYDGRHWSNERLLMRHRLCLCHSSGCSSRNRGCLLRCVGGLRLRVL
jgi:hypothetical protein